jgi:hypothetical protein
LIPLAKPRKLDRGRSGMRDEGDDAALRNHLEHLASDQRTSLRISLGITIWYLGEMVACGMRSPAILRFLGYTTPGRSPRPLVGRLGRT